MSVFPKDTIKNVSEAVGIANLKDDVAAALAQDVEYRIHELIQEATKFMRHSKRSKLSVDDINAALRVKNVEPLYGYSAGDTPQFRKTTVSSGDIYFTEDNEVDFDTILSKPLPKIPLDVTFTAHWLAIEGVQPAIPQNPTPGDAKVDLLNKRQKAHGVSNGISDQVDVKPLVKHVLSKELQMYFERITEAVFSEDERLRSQAFESLRMDPGLHQLLPYFVQHIHKKVTQNHKNPEVLDSMLSMAHSLLHNKHLFIEPYLHQLIPPILSCLVGRNISDSPQHDHWSIRHRAATLIANICKQYGKAYHTLQPRITKTLLRAFLDPARSLTTQYGAIIGLNELGAEVASVLVVPNIKFYAEHCIKRGLEGSHHQRKDALKCQEALVRVLKNVMQKSNQEPIPSSGPNTDDEPATEQDKAALIESVGDIVGRATIEKTPGITKGQVRTILDAAK